MQATVSVWNVPSRLRAGKPHDLATLTEFRQREGKQVEAGPGLVAERPGFVFGHKIGCGECR